MPDVEPAFWRYGRTHAPEVTHCSKQTGVLFPRAVHACTHVKQVVTGSGAEARMAKQNISNITQAVRRFMGKFPLLWDV